MFRKKGLAMIMLICCGGCVGCNSPDAETLGEVIQYVEIEEAQGIEVYGSIEANVIEGIHLDFPVTIEAIYVKEGDYVKKGEPLLKLNYDTYKEQIAQKERAITLLEIEMEGLKSKADPLVIEIDQLEKERDRQQQLLDEEGYVDIQVLSEKIALVDEHIEALNAKLEVQYLLYEEGLLAEQSLEDMNLELAGLQKDRNELVLTIDKIKQDSAIEIDNLTASINTKASQMNQTKSQQQTEINLLQAKINVARTELLELEAKLDKVYIEDNQLLCSIEEALVLEMSPFVGKAINQGETIISLIDLEELVVSVDVPEVFINQVEVGDRAEIKFFTAQSEELIGEVSRIANKSEKVNGENMVKVDIIAEQEQLKYGYEVDVMIRAGQ